MASKKRILAIEKRIAEVEGENLKLTALLTFEGFPIFAQSAPADVPARFWAFSYGINSTFQYEVTAARLPRTILQVSIEKELGLENGEGVDVFTPHGIRRQQLIMTLYPSVGEAPYWFKQSPRPAGSDGKGLFLLLQSKIPSMETGEPVKVMEWPFFQVDRVSFDGGTNTMKSLQGPQISVSFEPDSFAR